MTRRALVFTVPKRNEVHYSKIQGPILGRVWAPLYHAYGYYMPSVSSTDPVNDDITLKRNSILNLRDSFITILSCAAFGIKPLIQVAIGAVMWAEFESAFATWDGHVTFGSSHLGAHAMGFYIWSAVRILLKGKFTTARLPFFLLVAGLSYFSVPAFFEFVGQWIRDDFSPVGEFHLHRMDHVAHIGGILTGFLNAHFLQLGSS